MEEEENVETDNSPSDEVEYYVLGVSGTVYEMENSGRGKSFPAIDKNSAIVHTGFSAAADTGLYSTTTPEKESEV